MSTNYVITNGATTATPFAGGAGGSSTTMIGIYDGENMIGSISARGGVDHHGNVMAPGFTAYGHVPAYQRVLGLVGGFNPSLPPCSYCRSGRDPARKTCHTCGAPYDL